MTRKVLVTGGAGYVGSHCCLALAESGFLPVVYDNLSTGHADFVQWGPLEHGDVRDRARLDDAIARHGPEAILHFAALSEVGESTRSPGAFFEVNVGGSITVIEAARAGGVGTMVFSSTCATYGDPRHLPLIEDHPQDPVNPYGRSKLMVEQALADYDRYTGFRSVCLRYFNAAGADAAGRIGERHRPETHAVPLAIQSALGLRGAFSLFGDDYDTRDGTPVRDYVHVDDLADAHVRALRHLLAGGRSVALNLGTGSGTTVRELIDAVERQTGRRVPVEVAGRRTGDAARLIADSSEARNMLGWRAVRTLDDIVGSACRWHIAERDRVPGVDKKHPVT